MTPENEQVFSEVQTTDPRWQTLEFGLGQLTSQQLRRIVTTIESGGRMVYDQFNYDESRGLWCPLAVGLDVPHLVKKMRSGLRLTNAWAKGFITEVGEETSRGFTLNPISGIPGKVYREDRKGDILAICRSLLCHRDGGLAAGAGVVREEEMLLPG